MARLEETNRQKVLKDHHIPRNGHKKGIKKNGHGKCNWGSIENEIDDEYFHSEGSWTSTPSSFNTGSKLQVAKQKS